MTDANELRALEPCPWCGHSEALEVVPIRVADKPARFSMVHCNGCGAEGPMDAADPSSAWNTRALIASREAAVKPLGDDARLVDRCAEDVTMMKAVIAEANNSLYGSQSFFMSVSGERPAHKYHLAEEIEKLKALSNTRYRQVETLTRELDKAREALGRSRKQMARIIGDHNAPSDCYATGPLTGDAFTDLVSCPSCEGERMLAEIDAALSATTDLGRDTENAG